MCKNFLRAHEIISARVARSNTSLSCASLSIVNLVNEHKINWLKLIPGHCCFILFLVIVSKSKLWCVSKMMAEETKIRFCPRVTRTSIILYFLHDTKKKNFF